MDTFFPKLLEYGALGAVVCVLFYILWVIINWAKGFISSQAIEHTSIVTKLNEEHTRERCLWMETLVNLNKSIDLHNLQSIEARKSAEDSHKYQKEEHEKLSDQMDVVCNSLKQTEQALGRINGYTKEH